MEETGVQPVNKTYNTIEPTHKPKKVPKRVLHFSDGIIEEYSTDEEEVKAEELKNKKESEQQVVDPKTLNWLPWVLYLGWMAGTSTLAVCDSIGEKLAWWLGITSPKYYYEIQEAKRMKAAEMEQKKQEDAEMAGWGSGKEGIVSSEEEIKERH